MASDHGKRVFTATDRIKLLNEIDSHVTKMVQAAGLAIKSLTMQSPEDERQESTLEGRREIFKEQSSRYLSYLSFVDVNLRRQIYALEEAGIISSEASLSQPHVTSSGPVSSQASKLSSVATGLANLDTGWLNSRVDKVRKEMEAQNWAKAQALVEGFGLLDTNK